MTAHPRLHDGFLGDAGASHVRGINSVLEPSGLHIRKRNGRYLVRPAADAAMLVLHELEFVHGSLTAEAKGLLRDDDVLIDESDAEENAQHFQRVYGKDEAIPSNLSALGVELMANVDAVATLEKRKTDDVRFFRLATSRDFHLREYFWRSVSKSAQADISWVQMLGRGLLPDRNRATGTLVASASHWVTAPLVARAQPLAAVYTTARGAEVIMVPEGIWNRPRFWANWPTGSFGLRLQGDGMGIYKTRNKKVAPHMASETLEALVNGTDRLLRHLTDPSSWVDEAGELDFREQLIAQSTLDLGLGAVNEMARLWGSDEGLWIAFRALGILQGLWEGADRGKVGLAEFLDPERISEFAVGILEPNAYREWAEDITNNWQSSLEEMFVGSEIEDAVDLVADLRNLVHGTGAPSARRFDRLDALARMEGDGMQLLQDIAVFWWAALLLNPSTHARVGIPPDGLVKPAD